ncbi:hypothetical protein [Aeromonas sp.]|uniref:hypothetical protein n=1 Tax=Aeromonas sp. TaxID=647 RepID=UPI00258A576C|nr:hypothetical protein [Aeromonas sp.]MCX7132145.1 hypothetical protein [Aeromonas sp.]
MEAKTATDGATTDQNWTHIHLMSGIKGRVVEQSNGGVVIQNEFGSLHGYGHGHVHLYWAPLNSDSQGEQA